MAINTVSAALAQYAENILWHRNTATAERALEALRYLQMNRAQMATHAGSGLTYEMIAPEIDKIEAYLGVKDQINSGARPAGLYKARWRKCR